ncbi:MAG: hypothetical protein LBV79_06185 [Candidatus Adiutrix sp.]|jgi:septal ring factor EnvC (AmiA/AmiB activator)|nr:hypothetical protein [Candidatus Adiutrix sp.]
MGKIKLIAALAAAGLLAGLGIYITLLKADLAEREAALAAVTANMAVVTWHSAAQTQELDANRLALALRNDALKTLLVERDALKTELNEVYANDPHAQTWADTPCPDAVLDCLRP